MHFSLGSSGFSQGILQNNNRFAPDTLWSHRTGSLKRPFSFHGLSGNQLEPPEPSQDKVQWFLEKGMEEPRPGKHNLQNNSSENLVPRPGLVVSDVFNDYIASELMSYNFPRPEPPSRWWHSSKLFQCFFRPEFMTECLIVSATSLSEDSSCPVPLTNLAHGGNSPSGRK